MNWQRGLWAAAAMALVGAGLSARAGGGDKLSLAAGQAEYLTHEPILVTLRLAGSGDFGLRHEPGACKGKEFHFEITPALKARKGGQTLPLEGKGMDRTATVRTYDLLEWFEFPAEGTWTVRAVVMNAGKELKSDPLKVTVRRPARGSKEVAAVGRLHHLPWSNYTTNAFCGDTFDLVKQWPDSRLARYAHYWNGVYSQNKKEYAKALESFRKAASYADFVLADHAEFGAIECLRALGRAAEASARSEELVRRLRERERGLVSTVRLLMPEPQTQPTGGR